jgi:hypothetical protein
MSGARGTMTLTYRYRIVVFNTQLAQSWKDAQT